MMNVEELLFFVGRCLSLSVHPERAEEIRKEIQTADIDWERIVWIASTHYVLPTLFVQFRNYRLLKELPEDLVEYMEEIYQLNLVRNKSIKKETINIVKALNSIDIAPILLKGPAHILDGLYSDLGERMIGDIDFLLPEKDILPAVEKLGELGYYNPGINSKTMHKTMKHFPRLQNKNAVAALEVHREVVMQPYSRKFDFISIDGRKKMLDMDADAYVLSDFDQIIHNVLNAQMNDNAYKRRNIQLRNIYDLLLLSLRGDTLQTAVNFGHYQKPFNAYLYSASKFMDNSKHIKFANSTKSRRYFKQQLYLFRHPRIMTILKIAQHLLYRFGRYVTLPLIAITNRTERNALIWRLTNREWYVSHFKSWSKFHG